MIRTLSILSLLSILLLGCEKINDALINVTRYKFIESINKNDFEEAASLFYYANNSSKTQLINDKIRVTRYMELMITAIRNDKIEISQDYNKYKISLYSIDTSAYKNSDDLVEIYFPSQTSHENSTLFGLTMLKNSWKKFSIIKFPIDANSIEEELRENLLNNGCTIKYNPTLKEKLLAIFGDFYYTALGIINKQDPLHKENYEDEVIDILGYIYNCKTKEELHRFVVEEFTVIDQGIIIVPENKCKIITDKIWDQYFKYLHH